MESNTLCSIKDLCRRYGAVEALSDINIDLQQNEFVSIIGPSGAGKTTLLRLIAGIEKPDGGTMEFSVPPGRDHPVILVFQDFMLFPGMSVARNVGFGLKARGIKAEEIRRRVMRLLEIFGIADKAAAYPRLLSAGQQQRVAIARALAVQPEILLLDEPFAHLDKSLKMETAIYLRSVQKEFGITMVAVTHDLEEAFAMSDRVGIMMSGRLVQLGPVEEVYSKPSSFEAARFLGPVNRFPVKLLEAMVYKGAIDPEAKMFYCRAESMSLWPDPDGPGVIEEVHFTGILVLYQVRLEHKGHKALLSVFSLENGLRPGAAVSVGVSNLITEKEEHR